MDSAKSVDRMNASRASRLEKWIDQLEAELEPLTRFILAGGSEIAARLHLARTVSRRAERRMVAYAQSSKVNSDAMVYMNRLSDFLFVLARVANKRAGKKDVFWDKAL